jgi:hypothetical protein
VHSYTTCDLCHHLMVYLKLLDYNTVNRYAHVSLHAYMPGEVQYCSVQTSTNFSVHMWSQVAKAD